MHPFVTFDVFPDFIRIDKHTFERPNYISYEQWYDFWDLEKERESSNIVKQLYEELEQKDDEITDLNDEIRSLEREIQSLEYEVGNLEEEVASLEEEVQVLRVD